MEENAENQTEYNYDQIPIGVSLGNQWSQQTSVVFPRLIMLTAHKFRKIYLFNLHFFFICFKISFSKIELEIKYKKNYNRS